MSEPRRVAFNTVSVPPDALPSPPAAAAAAAAAPPKKKRREERGDQGNVRFGLKLSEPSDRSHTEYNFNELLREVKRNSTNPDVPFNNEEKERKEMEAIAKKFEEKYGQKNHKRRKDRMQDLIDMGYGYDDTDPFIDNSEAYDELVPASLSTKYGGFYINTGTLQFRQTSDTEDEDVVGKKRLKSPKKQKLRDGEDRVAKKQRRTDEGEMKEKKPRKLKVPNESGVVALNAVKHQKKKRKNHNDTLSLAEMLKKFQKEKEAMKKQETSVKQLPASQPTDPATKNPGLSEYNLAASDQVFSILGSSNENDLLQEAANAMELLGDLDIDKLLAETPSGSPASESEESSNTVVSSSCILPTLSQKQVSQLPTGISSHLEKRLRDLKNLCSMHSSNEAYVGKVSEGEGKKKFFTADINTILLDIELQVQELNLTQRSGVYSYLASFLPCSKDTLMKRLKKLHLNEQDERLRDPTQKLKEAVANAMPVQLTKFQEELQAHTQARFAKMASEEDRDKNGSEEEDDDKPGKRVMGPRKKFLWNDYVRELLCNLVKIKLGCYELEQNKSQSAEDYLKTFMETEVKPIWPKGWMQSRILLKESKKAHNHLTATPAKKKVILAPKPKVKDSSPKKEQKLSAPVDGGLKVLPMISVIPISISSSSCTPNQDTICLDDSLDEDLTIKPPSLESVSDALSVFTKITRIVNNSVPATPRPQQLMMMKEDKKAVVKITPMALCPKEAVPSPKVVVAPSAKEATPSPKVSTPSPRVAAPSPRVVSSPSARVTPASSPRLTTAPSPRVATPSPRLNTTPSPRISTGPSPRVAGTPSPKASTLSPVPLSFGHLFGHGGSSSKKAQDSGRSGMTSLIAGYTAPSPQTVKASPASCTAKQQQQQQQPGGGQRLSQAQVPLSKLQQHHHNSLSSSSSPHVAIGKVHQNPVVKLSSCPQHLLPGHLPHMADKAAAAYQSSFAPSAAHLSSRPTASPPTSGSYMPKATAAGSTTTSVQGFKPPFTMVKSAAASSPVGVATLCGGSSSTVGSSRQSGAKLSGTRPSSSPSAPAAPVKKTSVPQKLVGPPAAGGKSSGVAGVPCRGGMGNGKGVVIGITAAPGRSCAAGSSVPVSRAGTPSNPAAAATANRSSPTAAGTRTNVSGGAGSGSQVAIKMLPSIHRPPSASGSSAGIQVTTGSTLMATTSPLTLMPSSLNVTNLNATSASLNTAAAFSMLGSLVPVSLPFQLPLNLLSFAPESAVSTTAAPTGSTSVTFQHNFAQNILKGLQSGSAQLSRSSVPAHLQQTYTDGNQNQGDSSKVQRKPQ
ncbi:ubinuclein-2 isoform X2 [Amblyraja radiata]|uniref:ubinuclein-2 isoform X2 n=1 Tax=Amblyraja radiata TaxID=386614 RepID=UPI001403BE39|nr:ubinuclein-2 isoform X2 [Amblyraja radiata]